jgi:hypothetical protein
MLLMSLTENWGAAATFIATLCWALGGVIGGLLEPLRSVLLPPFCSFFNMSKMLGFPRFTGFIEFFNDESVVLKSTAFLF